MQIGLGLTSIPYDALLARTTQRSLSVNIYEDGRACESTTLAGA
ncbi:hypothetical protein ABTH77_20080 [Acinetobacter baumannii]